MKALIIQHSSKTPVGTTAEWLKIKSIPYTIMRPDQGESFPQNFDFDIVFICGGGMNVDEELKYPWLISEKKFISQAIRLNKKIVGLCLGAQLCAEVLGAKVEPNQHWEVGWHKISLVPVPEIEIPAAPGSIMAFQWHRYRFDIPKEAHHFASNDICRQQGFVWRNQVLAFQFHPETTQEWANECARSEVPKSEFSHSSGQILEDTMVFQARLKEWYFGFLNSFLIDYLNDLSTVPRETFANILND